MKSLDRRKDRGRKKKTNQPANLFLENQLDQEKRKKEKKVITGYITIILRKERKKLRKRKTEGMSDSSFYY